MLSSHHKHKIQSKTVTNNHECISAENGCINRGCQMSGAKQKINLLSK